MNGNFKNPHHMSFSSMKAKSMRTSDQEFYWHRTCLSPVSVTRTYTHGMPFVDMCKNCVKLSKLSRFIVNRHKRNATILSSWRGRFW